MPSLSNAVLHAKLAAALPTGARFETGPDDVHPAIANVPGLGRVCVYLWTVTADRSASGRPAGEFKIQLILPGQPRDSKASLDVDGPHTVLAGYSPDYGVFVTWEAALYRNFAYSSNVQCREEMLREARDTGWAVAPTAPRRRDEVRLAFTPGNFVHCLRLLKAADAENIRGKWREAFLLANTPNSKTPIPTRDVVTYISRQRERVAASRLVRDSRFSTLVRIEYQYACAVCGVQLEIVEGAHIIPVRESGSTDDAWNGVALCPNHHALFDGSAFVIRPDLNIRIDQARVEYFRANGLAGELQILTDFHEESIRPPQFWLRDDDLKARMKDALARRTAAFGA